MDSMASSRVQYLQWKNEEFESCPSYNCSFYKDADVDMFEGD